MMHIVAMGLFCALWAFPACVPPVPPAPPKPPAPIVDGGTATCADACQNLQSMDCPGGRPSPRGVTCLDVCRNVQESGTVQFDLACIAAARTCQQADACR